MSRKQKSITIWPRNEAKTVRAPIFRLPWGKLNFLITIGPSIKSFEDITVNAHTPHTYLIHISLRGRIWAWQPSKVSPDFAVVYNVVPLYGSLCQAVVWTAIANQSSG